MKKLSKSLLKVILGLSLIALVIFGIKISLDAKAQVNEATNQLDKLTEDIINTIGKSPTVESVKKAKAILEERREEIRSKIKFLKDNGKLRSYSADENCSETNKCSESAVELDSCFRRNHNRLAVISDDLITAFDADLEKSNELIQAEKKSNKEIEDINKKIKADAEILDELNLLVKSYITFTDFEEN